CSAIGPPAGRGAACSQHGHPAHGVRPRGLAVHSIFGARRFCPRRGAAHLGNTLIECVLMLDRKLLLSLLLLPACFDPDLPSSSSTSEEGGTVSTTVVSGSTATGTAGTAGTVGQGTTTTSGGDTASGDGSAST